jgi:hypothetical protein
MFFDPDHPPTIKDVSRALGATSPLWEELVQFIGDNYQTEGEFKYYGKKEGWAFRVRKGGKALIMLSFNSRIAKAQIVLNPPQFEKAMTLPLSEGTRKMLAEAKVYHDGRWLFLPLATAENLADIKLLLQAKRGGKKG